jgi:BatD DUF11 like domain
MKRSIIYITFVLFAALLPLCAQDGTFTASVDQNKVAAGDQVQVTFTVSGGDVNGVKNFKSPNFTPFVVTSGPSQSTNMQWINGQMSGSVSYTYMLYARQTGKFTIEPAAIEYKGKTLKTDPLSVEVTQGKPQQPQKKQEAAGAANVGDNLFIKASADKQRVRLGEQLTVTFRLYTRLSVAAYDLAKAPAFEGFWSEDFDMPKQPAASNETLNGKQYRVLTMKKTALFATQAGQLKIAPLEVTCSVQMQSKRRSNDPFDSFFNDPFFQQVQTVNMNFKSNPLTITVDPIPANAPSGFSGAIGHFTFSASADKKRVKAGDAITLKLAVSGTGNIKLVTMPKPQLPADIESYEPKIAEDVQRDGGSIHGTKTAEYLLIPRNQGARAVEPMLFCYYDLERREYVSLRSPRFEFTIEQGKDFSSAGPASHTDKEDVRILGEDIRYIKLSLGSLQQAGDTEFHLWFLIGLLLPPIVFIGSWVYRKRMEKIYGNMPKLLFETAGREVNKRLKKARVLLQQGNPQSYNEEVLKAISEYLEHKLNTPKAHFSLDRALVQLQEHNVTADVREKLKFCMERAEFARYAPGADTTEARKELIDAAAEAIQGIESTFRKRSKEEKRS